MSRYKVSVITPFHNVEKSLFKKTWNSVANQTIGFNNVEWIISMHNCTKTEINYVNKMAKGHKNVKIKYINNDSHTPSSPKNLALKFAMGKYIAYLDADDTLKPNILKKTYEEAEKENADIIMFRMEHILESPQLFPIPETSLWNLEKDKIVLTKKNRDKEILYSENFFFITSKIFKREFLLKNKIHFDESMVFSEDYIYAIEALEKAKKIVVLPREIGYCYFIHGGSLAQGGYMDDATFLEYIDCLVKCWNFTKKYKIHTDGIHGQILWAASNILVMPDIKPETRLKVKKLIAPYVDPTFNVKLTRLHTYEDLLHRYWAGKLVVMNPKEPLKSYIDGFNLNSIANYGAIIFNNSKTDFGIEYNFKNIKTPKMYQQRVPLMSRDRLQETIKLQTKVGESNVLIPGMPTEYFINDVGELFMNTPTHFEVYDRSFAQTFEGEHTFLIARYDGTKRPKTNDRRCVKNIYDTLLKNYFWNYRQDNPSSAEFTSKDTDYFTQEDKKKFFTKLLKDAMADKKVTQIFAFDVKDVLYVMDLMKSMPAGGLKKKWPKLKVCIANNISNSRADVNKINKILNGVPHSNGLYFAEEGIIGAATEKEGVYEKFLDNNFYELLDRATGKVLNMSLAEPGKQYQLIISNKAGLYRYQSRYDIKIQDRQLAKLTYKILRSK